jgi:hypothetical protein
MSSTPPPETSRKTIPVHKFPSLDWALYNRMRAEGRLNLLLRLSEPLVVIGEVTQPRLNVIPFISRAHHLLWREQWTRGRW